jgi:hypothetical protein
MDEDEASKVLNILAHADGDCIYCARSLFLEFIESFPEYAEYAKQRFVARFETRLEGD